MKHVVFVSSNYPSNALPFHGTFVRQLVLGIARLGVKCSVISPASIFQRRYGDFDAERSLDLSISDNPITILRPRYISFSNKNLLAFNTAHLTQISFKKAVSRAMSHLDYPPCLLYGHFLYQSGAIAVHIASKLVIPSIVAVGESSFWSVEPMGYKKAIRDFEQVTGVIAVSNLIKKNLIKQLLIPEEKIIVLPNGVDLKLFNPRNRYNMRNKHKLPQNKFLIVFAGHFDERKGPHRLLAAVSGMDDVGLIFIGSGRVPLNGENIFFKGTVDHTVMPEILSAADIFVLPTLSEGSCNAILEALACGIPIVTSAGEFNDDIVDETVALRINPLDINEIRSAILQLKGDLTLRSVLSIRSQEKAKHFDINVRAARILEWIQTRQTLRGSC
ncbi:MAG: glycosyltransferase [Thermodesulfovibrionales bacterium]|nr:glycosyltransferase [Thermodesulfovibrionales bacterium]